MRKSNLKKWELLEEEDVSPSPWFPVFRHKVRLPNGKVIDDYYVSKLGDVAMILPVTSDNKIIFVRQYKHGVGDIILELPAGRVKKGHTSKQEAIIELKEETGYVVEKVERLGTIMFEPSKDTLRVYGFLARVHKQVEQELDETEDIEVVSIPIKNVDQKIIDGEIWASDTLALLHLAKLKEPNLFK